MQAYMFVLELIYSTISKLGIPIPFFQNTCVVLVTSYILWAIFSNFKIINRVNVSYSYNPIHFYNNELKKPVCMEEFIHENIPEFRDKSWSLFNPFLFNGHLQTMFAGIRKFKNVDKLYFHRQIRYAGDGGCVALDHVIGKDEFFNYDKSKIVYPKNQPKKLDECTRYMTQDELDIQSKGSDDDKAIVITLTGLSGSSAEAYIRCLYKKLEKISEFELFVINSRGCGNSSLSTPKLFCALWTEDIRELVKYFKKVYPNRKIYLFGVSLGSIVLSNYLAQEGENSGVELGIVLASIWDLRTSSYFLENGFISSLFYSTAMTFPLMMLLKSHSNELLQDPTFKSQYTNKIVRKIWKLKDFDNVFTSKLFGFTCADDYYTHASPIYKLDKIKTPYVNISSLDDPITGGLQVGALPLDQAKYNPFISMINTSLGGHVGFFKWNNERWYAEPLSKLIIQFHEKLSCKPGFEIQVDDKYIPKPVLIDGKLPINKHLVN